MALSWITVLIAITLQTSFLTPPFGYALFFLRGSAPKNVRMQDIYKGIVPYVVMLLIAIACVAAFPKVATWLRNRCSRMMLRARPAGIPKFNRLLNQG